MEWNGKPYHSLDYELRQQFGQKIYKLSLDGGELHVDGRIDSVSYEDGGQERGGLFHRLFG